MTEQLSQDTPARPRSARAWRWAAIVTAGIALTVLVADGAWRASLMVLSTILAAASTFPYIRQTVRGLTQPRLVTWGTWSLLTGMAGLASASTGDYPSAVFSFVGTLATGAVVVAAVRFGDRTFGPIDAVCGVLVLAGAGLWWTFDEPAIAVLTACLIDAVGLVPTAVNAWRRPEEEPTATFALIAAGGLIAACAAWGDWSATALAYPVYVAVSAGAVALITLRRDPHPTITAGLQRQAVSS